VGPEWAADQLDGCWKDSSADWDKSGPVVIFSLNPLLRILPALNFWDVPGAEVQDVRRPYTKVTNTMVHVLKVLYNEISGPCARSALLGDLLGLGHHAPEGKVPKLTKKTMDRAGPRPIFYDGSRPERVSMNQWIGSGTEYIMWGPPSKGSSSVSVAADSS